MQRYICANDDNKRIEIAKIMGYNLFYMYRSASATARATDRTTAMP